MKHSVSTGSWASRAQAARNRQHSRLWSLWCSLPAQLVLGLLVAVVVPTVVRWPELLGGVDPRDWLIATAAGCAVSFVAGHLVVRQMLRFPKAQGIAYAVPIVLVSYAILVGVHLLGRIEFSRYLLIVSFLVAVAWNLGFLYVMNRIRHWRFAIVPFGAIGDLELDGSHASTYLLEGPNFRGDVDAVVADLRSELPVEWERFLADCALAGTPVYHVKQVFEWMTGRVHIEHLSENHLGSLLLPRAYVAAKRATDLLLVALLGPVLMPLLAVLALLIRMEDGGPVFFVQTRMGYRGRPFRMIKFRTMHQSRTGPDHTEPDDPRVTRIGRHLRRHRLDELPQIVNVLSGQMSWIGPRPESLELAGWYETEVPFYRYRHIVRPGITGWAQVNQGQTSGVDQAREKLQYDFYYIKNFSIWLDLLVVMKSMRVLLTGHGAR